MQHQMMRAVWIWNSVPALRTPPASRTHARPFPGSSPPAGSDIGHRQCVISPRSAEVPGRTPMTATSAAPGRHPAFPTCSPGSNGARPDRSSASADRPPGVTSSTRWCADGPGANGKRAAQPPRPRRRFDLISAALRGPVAEPETPTPQRSRVPLRPQNAQTRTPTGRDVDDVVWPSHKCVDPPRQERITRVHEAPGAPNAFGTPVIALLEGLPGDHIALNAFARGVAGAARSQPDCQAAGIMSGV